MLKRRFLLSLAAVLLALALLSLTGRTAAACGGFFCQNVPVDQNAERIIFTQNADGTTSALIQIQYVGDAPEFSWILPIKTPITADDIEVPEDAMAAFTELEVATNVRYIPPPLPECAQIEMESVVMSEGVADDGVEVFASGEVGPYGFDVIGSEDPTALIRWLRDNNYRVEEQMEPLINVYVEEEFVFLAMRLLPDQGAEDVQPIKVTYDGPEPMIPLRLTAVAATPDMAVLVWFFGEAPVRPTNFAHAEVPHEDITFFTFGGNNYRTLLGQTADAHEGRAFVTEYAQPTSQMTFSHPILVEMNSKHSYLTRLNTVISPDEMTVDPMFEYDSSLPNVSNVRDLSGTSGQFDCERNGEGGQGIIETIAEVFAGDESAGGNNGAAGSNTGTTSDSGGSSAPTLIIGIVIGVVVVVGGLAVLGLLFMFMRRRSG